MLGVREFGSTMWVLTVVGLTTFGSIERLIPVATRMLLKVAVLLEVLPELVTCQGRSRYI